MSCHAAVAAGATHAWRLVPRTPAPVGRRAAASAPGRGAGAAPRPADDVAPGPGPQRGQYVCGVAPLYSGGWSALHICPAWEPCCTRLRWHVPLNNRLSPSPRGWRRPAAGPGPAVHGADSGRGVAAPARGLQPRLLICAALPGFLGCADRLAARLGAAAEAGEVVRMHDLAILTTLEVICQVGWPAAAVGVQGGRRLRCASQLGILAHNSGGSS